MNASQSASVPLPTPTAYFVPWIGGQLLLEPLQHGPHHVIAGLQNFLHVGVDFGLNVVILPDMTIK